MHLVIHRWGIADILINQYCPYCSADEHSNGCKLSSRFSKITHDLCQSPILGYNSNKFCSTMQLHFVLCVWLQLYLQYLLKKTDTDIPKMNPYQCLKLVQKYART